MKKVLLFIILFSFAAGAQAQDLLKPFDTVSNKKTTFITMEDGKEVKGTVKDLDRKKGLIEEIKIKDEKGKKKVVPIEDIKHAYIPQGGLDKLMKASSFLTDATQWDEDGLYDKERFQQGYAYFEKSMVQVKKKTRTLLMQLLNPTACSKIKIYHDPFANESASLGVGGIKVAGGEDKSYYVRKNDGTAFKIGKKNYKLHMADLFGDCPEVKEKYADMKWGDFVEAVFAYNKACK